MRQSRFFATCLAAAFAFAAPSARAASVNLTANDFLGNSFEWAGNWSDGKPPAPGNDYSVGALVFTSRYSYPSTPRTFRGDSLTIGNGVSLGYFALIQQGTQTVNNLRLDNGCVTSWASEEGRSFSTLAGNVTLLAGGGRIEPGHVTPEPKRTITVDAVIQGSGSLSIGPGITYLRKTNSHSGGTLVMNDAELVVKSQGGLGTGNVTIQSGGHLTLEPVPKNAHMSPSATLVVQSPAAAGTVNLNFEGAAKIAALSLSGTVVQAGTWGSPASGAPLQSAIFTGSGKLMVGTLPLVTLTQHDHMTALSFKGSGYWSDALPPSSTKDYASYGYHIATPYAHPWTEETFQGNSLRLANGSILALLQEGKVTIDNLILDNALISNWSWSYLATLAGHITLVAPGGAVLETIAGRTLNLESTLVGDGPLVAASGTSILTGRNRHTGGTTLQTGATLIAQSDGALGLGAVTMQTGSQLILEDSANNAYIAEDAPLILAPGMASGSVNLNFEGTNPIGSLSFDSGATFAAPGTWGAPGSGADHTSSVFTGPGMLDAGHANSVVNSLGDEFTFQWKDNFTAENIHRWWSPPDPAVTDNRYELGNLVMPAFIDGGNTYFSWLKGNQAYKFGRYEARIYHETPPGIVSAFFTVKPSRTSTGAPLDWNEIDIMEQMDCSEDPNNPNPTPQENLHWGSEGATPGSIKYSSAHRNDPLADGWHTWTLDWTPNYIAIYVDGSLLVNKLCDNVNNGTAKTLFDQYIMFGPWIAVPDRYTTGTEMAVDKVSYYPLKMDSRPAGRYDLASAGITRVNNADGITEGVISGLANNRWVTYKNVDLTAFKNVSVEVACAVSTATIQIRKNSSSGTLLGTIPVPNTGSITGDGNFALTGASIASSGTSDVCLLFKNDCGSLRNVHFFGSQPTSTSRRTFINAWNYTSATSGVSKSDEDFVHVYASGTSGNIVYNNFDFSQMASVTLEMAGTSAGAQISLRKGSATAAPFAVVTLPQNHAAYGFKLLTGTVSGSLTGTSSLYVTFPNGYHGQLRSLRIQRTP